MKSFKFLGVMGLGLLCASCDADNANEKKGATTVSNELQHKVIKEGTGDQPKAGDRISVHYVGTLPDGTKFDSSRDRGQPFQFTVGIGQVIKGWDQGLMQMKVGGRSTLIIPPHLAYGDRGAGAVIKPGDTLHFDVELHQHRFIVP